MLNTKSSSPPKESAHVVRLSGTVPSVDEVLQLLGTEGNRMVVDLTQVESSAFSSTIAAILQNCLSPIREREGLLEFEVAAKHKTALERLRFGTLQNVSFTLVDDDSVERSSLSGHSLPDWFDRISPSDTPEEEGTEQPPSPPETSSGKTVIRTSNGVTTITPPDDILTSDDSRDQLSQYVKSLTDSENIVLDLSTATMENIPQIQAMLLLIAQQRSIEVRVSEVAKGELENVLSKAPVLRINTPSGSDSETS